MSSSAERVRVVFLRGKSQRKPAAVCQADAFLEELEDDWVASEEKRYRGHVNVVAEDDDEGDDDIDWAVLL